MGQEVLGGFEHQVLLAVAQRGNEAYSAPVVMEIEQRTGREVASAAVYVTLRRLEKRGLLASRMVPPPAEEGGRDRRVFSLCPEGVHTLRESKRTLTSMWECLTTLDELG